MGIIQPKLLPHSERSEKRIQIEKSLSFLSPINTLERMSYERNLQEVFLTLT